MKLRSVNVGQPRENPWKTMKLTGIDKRPVASPVMVRAPRAKGMIQAWSGWPGTGSTTSP